MSACRTQALIDAPASRIWDLLGDPRHHPQWWPRVVEVRGRRFEEGARYAQVTRQLGRESETTLRLERLEDLREIHMRCMNTGTYTRWLLTEAQGGTFVDVEFGMDPIGAGNRAFDVTFGRLFFRRWLHQSLSALERVAAESEKPH
jgi:uncharacterized protein YndB with AHSA1/START domain